MAVPSVFLLCLFCDDLSGFDRSEADIGNGGVFVCRFRNDDHRLGGISGGLHSLQVDPDDRLACLDLIALFVQHFEAFTLHVYRIDADMDQQAGAVLHPNREGVAGHR